MCGLFGWYWRGSTIPPYDLRVRLATLLGDRNDNRGGKSWGWAALPTPARPTILIDKGLGLIVGESSNMATHSALMGHTRQPTTGAVVKENSHPFEIGGLVGAHNGMVHNHDELEQKYPERKSFQVDSQHIFAHLAEGRDMKEIECYGVIEWIEKAHPDTFLLCKLTASGDIEIAQTKHGVVWSSNESHLLFSVRAAGMEIVKRYSVKYGEVVAVEGGKLWDMARKIEVSTYARTSYACTSGGYSSNGGNYSFGTPGTSTTEAWNARHKKRKGSKPSETVCTNDMCGSPVTGGICTMMFDESCTGADLMFAFDPSTLEAGTAPDNDETIAVAEGFDSLSPMLFADAYVKSVCQAACAECKTGDARVGHYHVSTTSSGTTTYLPCHGPDDLTVKTYLNTRSIMGEINDVRRDKLSLAAQQYGWSVKCEDAIWTASDLFRLTQEHECKMCHDMRIANSFFCAKHNAQKAEDDVCAEPSCLIKLSRWDTTHHGQYCRRHSCETVDCNGLAATGLYCPECLASRAITPTPASALPAGDSTVSAATKAN